ncbi:MAG: hypothetical protein ACK4QL_05925 [Pseudanabaenaceae cyanobacterium]
MFYKNMIDMLCELQSQINKHLADSDINSACHTLSKFVENIVLDQRATGRVFGALELDHLCQSIWNKFNSLYSFGLNQGSVQENLSVYLATELYTTGGHTAVIEDLIKFQPDREHVILLTDCFNHGNKQDVLERFNPYSVHLIHAPVGDYLQKAVFIKDQLSSFRPSEVFLFNHYHDPVSMCVAYGHRTYRLYYYHHCDHNCALGLYLDDVVHIDPHPFGYFNCQNLNLKNVTYLPLTVTAPPEVSKRKFLQHGYLITCSSGNLGKFTYPYAFSYLDEIPKILRVTHGKHIHIGHLTDELLSKIYTSLSSNSINSDKFVYIPWVKSLAQAMIDNAVDLYISSFPIGGGKATVEVMASGTPIINHLSYKTALFSGGGIVYPEALTWRYPENLYHCLESVTVEILQEQSELARYHYLKYNSPEVFIQTLMNLRQGNLVSAPMDLCNDYIIRDDLRVFLDELQISLQQLQPFLYQLEVTKKELERSSQQILELKKELEGSSQQILELKKELEGSSQQLYATQQELALMKQSKFWKLRNLWFKIKEKLRLSG